ncbi:MAG: hypothetical protein IJ935_03225 [Afipia sp.]|nr:hypothetical protein [Afipia sp.]
MKKRIDIEKLLQWAMREELPKGKPVTASAWDVVMSYGQLGARIQTSGHGYDGFGFVPGAPHEDAVIVADAVGKISDEARFEDADNVGKLFGDLVAIAEDAIASLLKAQFNPRAMIISKAIGGARPPWDFECPTPRQMKATFRDSIGALRDRPVVYGTDAQGDTVMLMPNRGRAVARDGLYDFRMSPRSPLHWDPSVLHIGHARAEYFAWHCALVTLANDLAGKLKEFEPTAPAVRAMPWITGQVAASRVLSDGLPPGLLTVKLPLQPKRHAPGKPIESEIEARMRAGAAARRTELAKERKASSAHG